jgi:16S rRNA (guanine(966)-N(2))-methyltransferase RsmD
LRIISGSARGRSIEAPQGADTRPTLDKVREAIFGAIQFDVPASTVLDLFAGSGAMGLEALSRQASFVTFNDAMRKSCAVIERNIKALGFQANCELLTLDYIGALDTLSFKGRNYDIIFLDPPYGAEFADKAIERILELGLLKENGRIIIEHDIKTPPLSSAGCSAKTKRYGSTGVTTIQKEHTHE